MCPTAQGGAYHPLDVHLRRAILLFALVLGLTALAAAVAPTHEEPAAPVSAAAPAGAGAASARTLSFAPRAGATPLTRTALPGEHVVLSVAVPEAGMVTIPRLGQTASAEAGTPATFDVLAPAAGRYDVLFAAAGVDPPRRVGTLVTRP